MGKRLMFIAFLSLALCLILTSASYAEKATGSGGKAKTFWQKLFNYPANVANESVSTVAETGKRGTEVITKEVKRVGEVTSGDVAKTKELITEPIVGTAETTVKAVEETVQIPVEAAKEPAAVENK